MEGSLQDGMENYTETPLQLAAAAGKKAHTADRTTVPLPSRITKLYASETTREDSAVCVL